MFSGRKGDVLGLTEVPNRAADELGQGLGWHLGNLEENLTNAS